MGTVIKVENFKADTIFEHGISRPKLKLAIKVDIACVWILMILMFNMCVGLKIFDQTQK